MADPPSALSDNGLALLLGLVQGITEFLPISSTAHLLFFAHFFDLKAGLWLEAAVHGACLIAVLTVLAPDLNLMMRGWRHQPQQRRLLLAVAISVLPLVIVSLLVPESWLIGLRTPLIAAIASLGFALLLGFADRIEPCVDRLTLPLALVIGLGQTLALIPGVSRTGIVVTILLLAGWHRQTAAKLALLTAVPVLLGALVLTGLKLPSAAMPPLSTVAIAMATAGLSAYACARGLLALVRKIGYQPFVIYRCVFSAFLLLFVVI